MVDQKAVMFGIGLLILGIACLSLPFSPALQTVPPFNDPTSKYVEGLQATGAVSIVLAIIIFVLAYKNKIF